MWRKLVRSINWHLISALKRDLDWHNAELHKAADEIERLRDQIARCYNCSAWKD